MGHLRSQRERRRVWYCIGDEGWKNVLLISALVSSLFNDHRWLKSAPEVNGPDYLSPTNVGPAAHWSLPRRLCVAVGKRAAGPTPQMMPSLVGSLGENQRLCRVSPSPDCLPAPGGCPFG